MKSTENQVAREAQWQEAAVQETQKHSREMRKLGQQLEETARDLHELRTEKEGNEVVAHRASQAQV